MHAELVRREDVFGPFRRTRADFFSLISVTEAASSLLVNCLLGPLARAASEGLSPPFWGYVGHRFLPVADIVPRPLPSHCLPRLHKRSLT